MADSPDPRHRAPEDLPALAGRGVLLLAAGGAIAIVTWWARTASPNPAARFVPYLLLLAGAYLAITGVEKLAGAWKRGRAGVDDPETSAALQRRLVAGALVLLAIAALGAAAWRDRAPYWRAVKTLAEGDTATDSLRTIAERHAAAMQAGASGAEALASWDASASQALPLKGTFTRSLEAAQYLAASSSGSVKERADEDVIFYGLCLEWMSLYEQVQTEIRATSMAEPSVAWGQSQDAIIERIQQLPSARSSR
jgi:hypothetical protein